MRALSIRQPYAELILRGIKPVEFRSRQTRVIGERFHKGAGRKWAAGKLFLDGCRVRPGGGRAAGGAGVRGDNVEAVGPGGGPEPWMLELVGMLIVRDLQAAQGVQPRPSLCGG